MTPVHFRVALSDMSAKRLLWEMELQHEFVPSRLEFVHICFAEHGLEAFISSRIFLTPRRELAIKLHEQSLLLQVIAEIPRLRIIRAAIFAVESILIHRRQFFERWHAPRLDRLLKPLQPPVGVPMN